MTTKPIKDPADGLTLVPIAKDHAADRIVEQLGIAIIRGELREGDPLPGERILAERFGVARGTVRQAIHKLADWGLVQVRQGGTTRVASSEDERIEVIQLRYRLGPLDARERREWLERRMTQGLALVTLAEQHATPEELEPLRALVESYVARGAPDEEMVGIERQLWIGLARATKNRLFEREVRWWMRVTDARREEASPSAMSTPMRAHFYQELMRRLVAKDASARYYLEMTQLVLKSDTTELVTSSRSSAAG